MLKKKKSVVNGYSLKMVLILILFFVLISCGQNGISCKKSHSSAQKQNDSLNTFDKIDTTNKGFLGSEFAKIVLDGFLKDSTSNLSRANALIENKEDLISVAEPILFRIYGKQTILSERPYEIYQFGDYWIMLGTLQKDWKGGTFAFAINRKTCEIVGLNHGK